MSATVLYFALAAFVIALMAIVVSRKESRQVTRIYKLRWEPIWNGDLVTSRLGGFIGLRSKAVFFIDNVDHEYITQPVCYVLTNGQRPKPSRHITLNAAKKQAQAEFEEFYRDCTF